MDGSSVSDGLHVGLDAHQPYCSEQHCRKRIGKDAGKHKLHTQVTLLNFHQTSLLVNNKEFYFLSFVNYNWSSQMFVGHSKYK